MKKMLLATAALLITGCAQQTFTLFKTNRQQYTKGKKTITHHFFVSELTEENCRCSQNLWRRRKMLLKQNPANILKDCSVLLLRYLYSAKARVYCSQ